MLDRQLLCFSKIQGIVGGDGLNRSVQDILTSDHHSLDALFSALEDALAAKEPVRIYRSLDLFWARLAVHIRAEHLVIFPAIREHTGTMPDFKPYLEESLGRLRRDHDFFIKQLARAVKAMRLVPAFGNEEETIEVVCGLVDSIKQRLAEHDRFEEDNIYPMVGTGAGGSDSIAARTLKELENLPPRLRSAV